MGCVQRDLARLRVGLGVERLGRCDMSETYAIRITRVEWYEREESLVTGRTGKRAVGGASVAPATSRERARVIELGDGSGIVLPAAVVKMEASGAGSVVVFMVCVSSARCCLTSQKFFKFLYLSLSSLLKKQPLSLLCLRQQRGA